MLIIIELKSMHTRKETREEGTIFTDLGKEMQRKQEGNVPRDEMKEKGEVIVWSTRDS